MAEILGQFDVIALTELRAEVGDVKRIMDVLGPTWRLAPVTIRSTRPVLDAQP